MKYSIVFDIGGVLFNQDTTELYVPHKEGIEVLTACAEHHGVYICSNVPQAHLEHLTKTYPDIMGVFKGIVVPHIAGARKPQAEIFQYLLTEYKLDPHSSIFIDDKATNVVAASQVGLIGIHADDFKQVKKELQRLQVIR